MAAPPPFSVDPAWVERLAQGQGRDEALTGMQKRLLMVIFDGRAPIGAAERAAYNEYLRFKDEFDRSQSTQPATPPPIVVEPVPEISEEAVWELVSVNTQASPKPGTSNASLPDAYFPAGTRREGDWTDTAQEIGQDAWTATVGGARAIGNALHSASTSGNEIKAAVQSAAKDTGETVREVAIEAAKLAREVRGEIGSGSNGLRDDLREYVNNERRQGNAGTAGWANLLGSAAIGLVEIAGKALAGTVELTGLAVAAAGQKTAEHSHMIGDAASGVVTGAASLIGGAADSVGVTDADIQHARIDLEEARLLYSSRRHDFELALNQRYPYKKDRLLEQTTIAGMVLADILASNHVPPDIQHAYEAAYPEASKLMDFHDKALSMGSTEEMQGLINGVKGKLFETTYLDELNNGSLPHGWSAKLAESATQPGWDISIFDDHHHLKSVLSAKATEHASYINHALKRYPDIDVVSTSEVYAALSGTPAGSHLIDGGISNVNLQHATQAAADGTAGGGIDSEILCALSLGPAAYRHFGNSDKPMDERTSGFTQQVTRAKTAAVAGKAATLVVPFEPITFVAAMGLSLIASVGNNRREQLQRLVALHNQIQFEAAKVQKKTLRILGPHATTRKTPTPTVSQPPNQLVPSGSRRPGAMSSFWSAYEQRRAEHASDPRTIALREKAAQIRAQKKS